MGLLLVTIKLIVVLESQVRQEWGLGSSEVLRGEQKSVWVSNTHV